MAYAALVSLGRTIDHFLNCHEKSISPQHKQSIVSINEHIIFLQRFLEKFAGKGSSLEGRIRDASYAAEDIIELFMLEHNRDLDELIRVTKEMECISEEVMKMNDNNSSITVKLDGDSTFASSSSSTQKEVVVGFDNDLMEIKFRLCGESSKREIIPIVGMGGIGKTTLAKTVYHDPLIMEHFQIRVWVTVSQDYSVRAIVKALLLSMEMSKDKADSTEEQVYKNLKGKRYLVVLDDVWSVEAWDDLKMMFPDDYNGSRIMLTTRLSDVATYADYSIRPHEMRLMDEHQSWNLFRHKLFKQDPCPLELEQVGKMIVRSCRGLPLAIAVISGLLVGAERTKAAWSNIARDIISAVSANNTECDKILSLSYTHLPHHLKPCFLYIGGFPEDYELRASKLLKLWVAEGFLKPNGCGNKSLEETGEECLEDLVKRSLVLVNKRKCNGKIKSFTIHDLMRELCIRTAKQENFSLWNVDKFLDHRGMKNPRRVSITHFSGLNSFENPKGSSSTIRTIIHLEHGHTINTGSSLHYFRLLRVLDLSNAYGFFFLSYSHLNPCIPTIVFELLHLRYLALDYPLPIPATISNLRNLETLIISSNKHFLVLPLEIWNMSQLRHLVSYFHLSPFEEGATFALENLQTLSVAKNFICSEKILKMFTNLKKLGICYTADDADEEEYHLENLIYLQKLEKLKLMICGDFRLRGKVLAGFPETLKKLTLTGWVFSWKDMSIVGSLPNLEVLKLRDYACNGVTWETNEEEFRQLKCLVIEKSYLRNWITETSHFPRLKCLVLRSCWCLQEIPDGIGEIPTLELIELDGTNRSLVYSAKHIREDQLSYGNNTLQLITRDKVPVDYCELLI